MAKLTSLLLFSCFVSNFRTHFVNSDPHYGIASWDNIAIGSASSTTVETQSPATDQLLLWAVNSSFYAGSQRATNLHGNPVPSLTASQAIGTRGHVLLNDHILIEKLASFNRERIPERVVHAKGAGAHGYFTVTHNIRKYTKAKFLQKIGSKTRVFVRFSTISGERGTADTAPDAKGFSVKFYTVDGNHDLVGLNTEVFPIRDPMLFSDLNRSRKRNPQTNLRDPNMFWDFVSLRPETTMSIMLGFSDIGRPNGYRRMDGHGIHTFQLVNDHNEVVFCKFHWKSNQPGPALSYQESAELVGSNPDYTTQDLYDAIARGDFPSWTLYIQVMTIQELKMYPTNPFDTTRTWRQEEFPLIPVGRMVLDKNPINYFAVVEQSGFTPSSMVPGIEPSPDRMLSSRLFSYQDSIRYRLGVNWPQLPINRPEVEVHSYIRDGQACYTDNGGGSPNYFPNSFGGNVADTEGAAQVRFHVEGIVGRYDIPEDDHLGARLFLERDVDADHRQRLVESIADRLKDAKLEIRNSVLKNNFYPVSTTFGDEIRDAVQRQLDSSMDGGGVSTQSVVQNMNGKKNWATISRF